MEGEGRRGRELGGCSWEGMIRSVEGMGSIRYTEVGL